MTNSYVYQLKFVVTRVEDLDEIRPIVDLCGAPAERVLLMPEGRTREEIQARAGWLVEVCKATGYRYCPRLHVELYGNRRGT